MRALAKAVAVLAAFAVVGWLWTVLGAAELRSMHDEVDGMWSDLLDLCQKRGAVAVPALDVLASSGLFDKAMIGQVRARAVAASAAVDPAIIDQPDKFQQYAKTQQELSNALYAVKVTFDRHPSFRNKSPEIKSAADQLQSVDDAVFSETVMYSRQAKQYDAALRRFPGSVVGPREGLKPRPFFEITQTQPQGAPK